MVLRHKQQEFTLKCYRTVVEEDGTILEDIIVCYHNEKAILFARRNSVEKFYPELVSEEYHTKTQEEKKE